MLLAIGANLEKIHPDLVVAVRVMTTIARCSSSGEKKEKGRKEEEGSSERRSTGKGCQDRGTRVGQCTAASNSAIPTKPSRGMRALCCLPDSVCSTSSPTPDPAEVDREFGNNL